MAIRLRTVNGVRIALCACETDKEDGDVYLDDNDHYALSAKFMKDWQENGLATPSDIVWPEWEIMDTQKKRDAKEVHAKIQYLIELGTYTDGQSVE